MYLEDSYITDNVMLAYEMTHYIQIKRRGIDGYTAVKLDMSEACDLRMMMGSLGLTKNWIDLIIMNCVTIVRYHIKINGELSEEISPQRGLR